MRQYDASSFQEYEDFWDWDTPREFLDRKRDYAAAVAGLRPRRQPTSIERKIEAQIVRAMRNGGDGDLTPQAWLRWCKAFNGCCAYCNQSVALPVIEHVWPVSRGGDTTLTNVVPACRGCNSTKHARLPDEFLGRDFPAFFTKVMAANEAMRQYEEKP
jgi:5-methylcytosine-specific restriction endonuclease McrA